jgi:hypothetical protein
MSTNSSNMSKVKSNKTTSMASTTTYDPDAGNEEIIMPNGQVMNCKTTLQSIDIPPQRARVISTSAMATTNSVTTNINSNNNNNAMDDEYHPNHMNRPNITARNGNTTNISSSAANAKGKFRPPRREVITAKNTLYSFVDEVNAGTTVATNPVSSNTPTTTTTTTSTAAGTTNLIAHAYAIDDEPPMPQQTPVIPKDEINERLAANI